MKLRFLFFAFLYNFLAQAQDSPLPDYTPPSPQAAALTKFGDMQLNEHTGMLNTSIPLHSYNAGELRIPISLNYSGAGVKVDELATWTGIKWTLQAGGVITRQINDAPDEAATKRYFYSTIQGMTLGNGTDDAEELNIAFDSSLNTVQWDTKPDIFSFSFPGGSGTFFLDENFVPRIVKKDSEIDIAIMPSPNQGNALYHTQTFVITDPDGVKYYFGGDAVEISKLSQGNHQSVTNNAPTAYYLYHIEHPANGDIFFEYDHGGFVIINQSESNSVSKLSMEEQDWLMNFQTDVYCFEQDGGAGSDPYMLLPPLPYGDFYGNGRIKNEIHDILYLNRIYSPSSPDEVRFYSQVSSFSSHLNYDRFLYRIEVKSSGQVSKTIDFDYNFNASRFFLTKVAFNQDFNGSHTGPSTRRNEVYEMEYNGGLPARFARSQDHLGYSNGKINNNTLIPKCKDIEFSLENEYGADRTPDFAYAQGGSLKRIYYPTGGYTQIDYEPFPEKRFTHDRSHLAVFRHNYQNNLTKLKDTYYGLNNQPSIIGDDENGNPLVVPARACPLDQTLKVHCKLQADQATEHDDKVWVRVIELGTNTVVQKYFVMDVELIDGIEYPRDTYITFSFNLKQGKHYKIELEVDSNPNNPSEEPMMATAYFDLIDGLEVVAGAGVRVKRTADYTEEGNPSNIRRYYYCKKEDLLRDPMEIVQFVKEPNYVSYFTYVERCLASPPIWGGTGGVSMNYIPKMWYYKTLSSSPNDLHESIDRVYKEVVISYGGDNFENGGVEKIFHYVKNDYLLPFKIPFILDPDNGYVHGDKFSSDRTNFPGNANDYVNGTLIKETILLKKENQLYKQTEKAFRHATRINYGMACITGGIAFVHHLHVFDGYDNFQLAHYSLFSKTLENTQVVLKEYIDPVPLSIFVPESQQHGWYAFGDSDNDGIPNFMDEDTGFDVESLEMPYRKMVTITDIQYGTYINQPTRVAVERSEGGLSVTKNYYIDKAADDDLGEPLPSDSLDAFAQMENNHIYSKLIQSESYIDDVLLSASRTLYKDFGESGPSDVKMDIFPSEIQTSKAGQPFETRIVFHSYNGKGNPILVSKADGSLVHYSYNARNQVTRKIENYKISGTPPYSEAIDPDVEVQINEACGLHDVWPESFLTHYFYDSRGNLTQIVDKNCRKTFFEYDERSMLRTVRDHYGNILKEYDINYFRY